ncbi:hypothetical protein CC117_15155 [Parafrankia colletiae]|uniref:Tyr recombinase domain-containing protein n=1 Tax=Parafrankia colletiae TaxID=573497 RepID=A0A1S1R0R3_9ACTN|nr:hypothetical protein CC117_15155 [Parafrankia colletiae]
MHPKVVSERLGHADVAFTLRIYSHIVPGLDREAANQVASVILGTDQPVRQGIPDGPGHNEAGSPLTGREGRGKPC